MIVLARVCRRLVGCFSIVFLTVCPLETPVFAAAVAAGSASPACFRRRTFIDPGQLTLKQALQKVAGHQI